MDVYWFPRKCNQSRIGGPPNGGRSYACAIIALVTAEKLSHRNTELLKPNTLTDLLKDAMREGNEIHNNAPFRRHQSVSVPEAITIFGAGAPTEWRVTSFGLAMGEDLEMAVESLVREWRRAKIKARHSDIYILIVTDNKTVLLVVGANKCTLFDTHKHGAKGAVIAQVEATKLGKLCTWYSKLIRRSTYDEPYECECSVIYFETA